MKKNITLYTIAAVAAGALLLAKKKRQSGVSGVFSPNAKLNSVLKDIYEQLQELGADEVRHYMRNFPNEVDYNLVQYGNLLVYYQDIREMYENAGYSPRSLGSDEKLWELYKRQVGYIARTFFK